MTLEVEHIYYHSIWAFKNGAVFHGHRGAAFAKVIQIQHHSPLLRFTTSIHPDCTSRIVVNERRRDVPDVPVVPGPAVSRLLWFSAAQPSVDVSGEKIEFKNYLQNLIQMEDPDVVFVSSSGRGFAHKLVVCLLQYGLEHNIIYETEIGMDGGGFVVSAPKRGGNVVLDEDEGCSIDSGVDFIYHLP